MHRAEIAKRYFLFIVSLFFAAMGVAFTKHGEMGVSPISSVANVLSIKYTFFSLGSWLVIWNCVLIFGQVLILRKSFHLIQLLQIPLSFVFGWFTDLGVWMVSFIPVHSYFARMAMVLIGIVILGFGISLAVIADVIMNSAEAFVKAISDVTGWEFGNIKIAFDIFCVVFSIGLSLLFFDFTIVGTREGTVISALLTGIVVRFFTRKLNAPLSMLLRGER